MKTNLYYSVLVAGALVASAAQGEEKKTLGEKTAETAEKAKDKTVEVAGKVKDKTVEVAGKVKDKTVEAGQAVVSGTRKAVAATKDAVIPGDARKIEVIVTEHRIEMPRELPAGRTAFVVRNSGKEKHNFKIEGQGIEKNFLTNIDPNESKTLDVDLKPGNYRVFVPGKDAGYKGGDVDLVVK